MKNKSLFFSVMLIIVYSLPLHADDDLIRFVEPEVAKSVIERHFSDIAKNTPSNFTVKYNDETILEIAVTEYNRMLSENDGFVSADGVVDACLAVFNKILVSSSDNIESDYIALNCYNFIERLLYKSNIMNIGTKSILCIYWIS